MVANLKNNNNNNVYTHRKTLVSTLKELITLIKWKNIGMGRKWDHYAQVYKNKCIFFRRHLKVKTINTWSIVTESLIEDLKS